MKISYEDAMAELRTMFQNIEGGTIHELLVKNKGQIDPTIEDLLQMASEEESANENLFKDSVSPLKPSLKSSSLQFGNQKQENELSEDLLKELQEQQDLELALKLQEKNNVIQEDNVLPRADHSQQSKANLQHHDEQTHEKSKDTKNLKNKLSDKFSKLFKKKSAQTSEKNVNNSVNKKDNGITTNKSDAYHSTNVKTNPKRKGNEISWEGILKLQDGEIVTFENPIEGGGFYRYEHLNNKDNNAINLKYNDNNSASFYSHELKLTSNINSRSTNDQEIDKYFKIDDISEEEKSEESLSPSRTSNGISTTSGSNGLSYGNPHFFQNGERSNRGQNRNGNIMV